MTISKELAATLAMDAYNRGYNEAVSEIGVVGTAALPSGLCFDNYFGVEN